MKIRSKRELYLVIFVVIFVPILLLWNVLNPPKTGGTAGKLLPLEQAKKKTEDARRTLARLRNEQEEAEPRVAKMSYELPAEQLEPRVVRDLQLLADKAGVRFREVKPLRARALANGSVRVPLEVRFRAQFQPNVVRFLYYVEDPNSKMVIDKINVTSADARFKIVEISAQITVFTRSTAGVGGADQGDTSNASKI